MTGWRPWAGGTVLGVAALGLGGCDLPLETRRDGRAPRRPAATTVVTAAARPAFVARHLARLRAAAGCGTAAGRDADLSLWCLAPDGWDAGRAAAPPTTPRTLVGLTVWVPSERPVEVELRRRPQVFALGFGREGDAVTATVADIWSAGTDPYIEVPRHDLVAILRGEPRPVTVGPHLYGYLVRLPARARRVLARDADRWWLDEPGEHWDLKQVGARWVAVGVPHANPRGVYVSIFVAEPFQQSGG